MSIRDQTDEQDALKFGGFLARFRAFRLEP